MQTPLRKLTHVLRKLTHVLRKFTHVLLRSIFCTLAFSTLSACALFDTDHNRALVTNSAGDIQTVATRADRRIAFVDSNWLWGAFAYPMNGVPVLGVTGSPLQGNTHHYCAEPSPDVSADLLAELVARLGVGKYQLGHDAGLSSSTTTLTDPLFNRSQGVQLFRDGLFALCQAHHNGAVGAAKYNSFIATLIDRSSYLIALELALRPLANGEQIREVEMAALLGLVEGVLAKLHATSVANHDSTETAISESLPCGPPAILAPFYSGTP